MLGLDTTVKAREIAQRLLALRSGDVPPGPPGPRRGVDYPRLQQPLRWFEGILQLYRAAARALAEQVVIDRPDDDEPPPPSDEPDRLVDLMCRVHRVLLEHPVA